MSCSVSVTFLPVYFLMMAASVGSGEVFGIDVDDTCLVGGFAWGQVDGAVTEIDGEGDDAWDDEEQ